MNSKKLCCICVLFSLLAGCASESSIDEKKKKAQVTQSNINKNTPQQLTDKDLFGNETTLAVSEEDIQAALDGDEFRVPLNSPVILVQSADWQCKAADNSLSCPLNLTTRPWKLSCCGSKI